VDTFIRGVQAAGANVTVDSFIAAMDKMSIPGDMFGGPDLSFSGTKRLGSQASRMSQIQDGKWKVVSKYVTPAN